MAEIDFECPECQQIVRLAWRITSMGGDKKTFTCQQCNQFFVFEYNLWMQVNRPKYRDKEWLRQKYWDERLSMDAIGKECGVTAMTIRDWLIKHDIERRLKGGKVREHRP